MLPTLLTSLQHFSAKTCWQVGLGLSEELPQSSLKSGPPHVAKQLAQILLKRLVASSSVAQENPGLVLAIQEPFRERRVRQQPTVKTGYTQPYLMNNTQLTYRAIRLNTAITPFKHRASTDTSIRAGKGRLNPKDTAAHKVNNPGRESQQSNLFNDSFIRKIPNNQKCYIDNCSKETIRVCNREYWQFLL